MNRNDAGHDKNTNDLNEDAAEESHVIEIWSKAAIGYYLWQHILEGGIHRNVQDGIYVYGSKKIENLKFKFRSGPSLTIEALRRFVTSSPASVTKKGKKRTISSNKNIILVLNGRDEEKVETSTSWLREVSLLSNFLRQESNQSLRAGVVLLGNEFCFNSWIKPYLSSSEGPISFLFITYDWKLIDDREVFQWPLGVATYRNFPVPEESLENSSLTQANNDLSKKNDEEEKEHEVVSQVLVTQEWKEHRPYVCNFLGTIYSNSSREEVLRVLSTINQKYQRESDEKQPTPPCFVKARLSWTPSETTETRDVFIQALKSSDLTLNPIGMNHECYRIYEAMQMGSLPVLEERLSHVRGKKSACDESSAYRLLKRHNAPVLFVSNWTSQLPSLIEREVNQVSKQVKVDRRERLLSWYRDFKLKMRENFVRVVNQKFFQAD
jgi:hypothetical protein